MNYRTQVVSLVWMMLSNHPATAAVNAWITDAERKDFGISAAQAQSGGTLNGDKIRLTLSNQLARAENTAGAGGQGVSPVSNPVNPANPADPAGPAGTSGASGPPPWKRFGRGSKMQMIRVAELPEYDSGRNAQGDVELAGVSG